MISIDMLTRGYDDGLVRIIDSPLGDGAVCSIGENWFYFGGMTAEEYTAAEYIKVVPKAEILREIFSVLEDFRKEAGDFGDEYMYYDSYLSERLNVSTEGIKILSSDESGFVIPYIVEFLYESVTSDPDSSMLVVLDRTLSSVQIAELKDSISSYIDEVDDWDFEGLVADVLNAAGYRYRIIEPAHTFRI